MTDGDHVAPQGTFGLPQPLPPPPVQSQTNTYRPMGSAVVQFWRVVGGVLLGCLILVLPMGAPTLALRPLVFGTAIGVSVCGVLWAFHKIGRIGLLNAVTTGVVIVGLVVASGIDGVVGIAFLVSGFAGVVCLGIWISVLLMGRRERKRHWWTNPKWWAVPVLATAALALSPSVHTVRFDHSRADLTVFAERQLALPLVDGRRVGCTFYSRPQQVGSYGITSVCVQDEYGPLAPVVRLSMDDASEFELDYGTFFRSGDRIWRTNMTHS